MAEQNGFRFENRCANCIEIHRAIEDYRDTAVIIGKAALDYVNDEAGEDRGLTMSEFEDAKFAMQRGYRNTIQCFLDESAMVCDGTDDPTSDQPQPCRSPLIKRTT